MDTIGQILRHSMREYADKDPSGTIDEWIMWLLFLREAFGGDARVLTDSGIVVEPGYHVFGRKH